MNALALEQTQSCESAPVAAPAAGFEARGLEKSYGERRVLRGVSIRVEPGEVVGLLGPNGAGKTTTFYIMTGLVAPDGGEVRVDGVDVTRLTMHRRARLGVGYLPQEASIFRGLDVEDNIRAVAEIAAPDRATAEARVARLLAEFGLTELRHNPALALSGGERRRVEIARALAAEPRYLLLDEPLAGIDPLIVGEIRQLVARLRERGIGVLITDHNVRDAFSMIDRAYILHDGRVLREGTPREIADDPVVRRVYLGESFAW